LTKEITVKVRGNRINSKGGMVMLGEEEMRKVRVFWVCSKKFKRKKKISASIYTL